MKANKTSSPESDKDLGGINQKQLHPTSHKSADNDLEKDRLLQELQVHHFELEMQNDELRRANEENEMQRIRFLGIYELAPIGYFVVDKSGTIQEVNSAGSKLLDIDRADILGRRFMNFVATGSQDNFYHFLRTIVKTQEKRSCQIQFTSYRGKAFFGQLEGIAFENTPGGIVTCYLAVIDISERIEAVAKLEETKERLELALEASDAGTWEYDYSTGKIFLDESICHICGIDEDSYSGEYQRFLQGIHPKDRYTVDQYLRTCINKESEVNIEFKLSRPDDVGHVAMRGHLVRRNDGVKRFVGTVMDISEKKRLESETQKLRLEQQRIISTAIIETEARERKRISESLHDGVCQLLYGIKLKIQQIGSIDLPGDPLTGMSKLVDLAIREARNIAFELAPSILSDFGLPITIEEICKRLSTPKVSIQSEVRGLNQRLSLSLETCAFRIVQELINNAIKHSEASEIVVEVRKGRTLDIKVRDNGKGFDLKTVQNEKQGSGLRNVVSKVELYEGTTEIMSNPGKGTCVKVILNKLTD